MSEELRFCKDCKFVRFYKPADAYSKATNEEVYYSCHHPTNMNEIEPNLVTGQKRNVPLRSPKVLRARTDAFHCGPHGRWFEEQAKS